MRAARSSGIFIAAALLIQEALGAEFGWDVQFGAPWPPHANAMADRGPAASAWQRVHNRLGRVRRAIRRAVRWI